MEQKESLDKLVAFRTRVSLGANMDDAAFRRVLVDAKDIFGSFAAVAAVTKTEAAYLEYWVQQGPRTPDAGERFLMYRRLYQESKKRLAHVNA
jgi:hypothetical protein